MLAGKYLPLLASSFESGAIDENLLAIRYEVTETIIS